MERRVTDSLVDDFGTGGANSTGPAGRRSDVTQNDIPDIVIRRLPLYGRSLQYLTGRARNRLVGRPWVAAGSERGADKARLILFRRVRQAGQGIQRGLFAGQINSILQLDREWPMALVGLGHLGRALLHYEGLAEQGFRIRAFSTTIPRRSARRSATWKSIRCTICPRC